MSFSKDKPLKAYHPKPMHDLQNTVEFPQNDHTFYIRVSVAKSRLASICEHKQK